MAFWDRLISKAFAGVANREVDKALDTKIRSAGDLTQPIAGSGYDTGEFTRGKKNAGIQAQAYSKEMYAYGCVYLISNKIAELPLVIYKDDKKTNVIEKHPFYDLMDNPNFKDSKFDLKESISANLELTGNAYLLLDKRDNQGIPEMIYSLNSSRVTPKVNQESRTMESMKQMLSGYEYGATTTYEVEDIIHEKKFNIDHALVGMSPIEAAALAIDTVIESRRQNWRIFKNGVNPDGSIETEQPFNQVAHTRLLQDFNTRYKGSQNAHEPMILWNGLQWKGTLSPKDLDFINGMKLTREDFCGFIYQIPLILLGVLEEASYNNILEAQRIFYEFCLKPRLEKNRETYQKLLDLWGDGLYIDFDLSGVAVLQETFKDTAETANKFFLMGVPLNTLIENLRLPFGKVKGGDVGYIPFNLVPIGSPAAEKPGAGEPPEGEKEVQRKYKARKYSEEFKEAKWKATVSRTDQIEKKYSKDLAGYFTEQEKKVLSNLNKFKSIESKKVGDNQFVLVGTYDVKRSYSSKYEKPKYDKNNKLIPQPQLNEKETIEQKKPINIESVLFNMKSEVERLSKVSKPTHSIALKTQAQAELDLLDIGKMIDGVVTKEDFEWTKAASEWIKKYGFFTASRVNKTVSKGIIAELIAAINLGEGIPKISKRIKDFYKDRGYTVPTGAKATQIARTEVISASNQGSLFGYEQAGVEKKGWLAALDERTRDTHIAAHNKYAEGIAIDKDFQVGAGSGSAPGQIDDPGESINCRCSIFPVIED